MTRFARAKGSKASNEKLPENSTPWGELRKQILNRQKPTSEDAKSDERTSSSNENENEGPAKIVGSESEKTVWADISDIKDDPELEHSGDDYEDFLKDDGTTPALANSSILLQNGSLNDEVLDEKPTLSNSNSSKENERSYVDRSRNRIQNLKKPSTNGIISRGNDLSYTMLLNGEVTKIVNFEGFNIKEVDAQRLQELRKRMYQEKKIPNGEIVRTIQLERRKAEKTLQREMKNVCYNCRKSGHYVSDCPESKNEATVETGICYKCGSTEHTSHECRLKHANFRFAKCFICNEQGHISRECPDNPRGIYPKGGACKGCGDVTHFAKDCPGLIKQKERKPFTLGTLNNDDIEALDDNFSSSTSSQPKKDTKRKHSGMKSFFRQRKHRKQMH